MEEPMDPAKAVETGALAISLTAHTLTVLLYRHLLTTGQMNNAQAQKLFNEARRLLLQNSGADDPQNRSAASLVNDVAKALVR
jgi:hypothetical protein